jgi:hypothetical protein
MIGRRRRDRAAAQIVAIGEAAGQHARGRCRRRVVLGVPDERGVVAGGALERRASRRARGSMPGKTTTAAFIAGLRAISTR